MAIFNFKLGGVTLPPFESGKFLNNDKINLLWQAPWRVLHG